MSMSTHLRAPLNAAVSEDVLTGARKLRRAFLETPFHSAARDTVLVQNGDREPQILLIRNGFALASRELTGERRAILDIFIPGDIVGLDHVVMSRSGIDITAAAHVSWNALDAASMLGLMVDRKVGLYVLALH